MTEEKKELLELYREFGDEAQAALDFIRKNSAEPVLKINAQVPANDDGGKIIFVDKPEGKPEDGIYIVYKDGSYQLFDGTNSKENVKYIGIIHDGHAFCIGLKDLGEYKLVRDYEKCPDEHQFYRSAESEALFDWEFIERTKHIQEIGTDIPLAENEYLPSLPMLVVIRGKVKAINEALKYVGGEPFDMDSTYWSVTECSSINAWLVYFYSGYVNYYVKYSSYVVRPVAAFNL